MSRKFVSIVKIRVIGLISKKSSMDNIVAISLFFFFFSSFSSSHLRRIYDRDVRGFFVVNRIAPREFCCSLIIGDYRQVKKGIFFVEDEISFGEGSGIIFYRKFLTETGRGKESLYVELYESVYISIIWRGFYLFLPMDRNFYNGYKFVLLI